jgi:transposase
VPLTNVPLEAARMARSDSIPTISVTLKLRPTCAQEAVFRRWLWHLTGLHNWTIKSIEREAQAGRYPSASDIKRRINGHSQRMGVPVDAMHAVVDTAAESWRRCFRKLARKPQLRGARRPLNSIGFAHGIKTIKNGRVHIPNIGLVRFHRQEFQSGHCGYARIVRRASGWYLCLFLKSAPRPIVRSGDREVGLDPGFSSLLTLSTGEVIERASEWPSGSARLAQAQRGRRKQLTARLQERIANRRKNRNHHISRQLVSENSLIAFSADNRAGMARARFGKSVASAGHGQLLLQLRYKCLHGGSELVEVDSRNSTRTCSACGALTGPTGYAGLSIRSWECSVCGTGHDRDGNAAVNILTTGRGLRLKSGREAALGIAL